MIPKNRQAIITSGYRIGMVITGGGSKIVSDLTQGGGASLCLETILIPYGTAAISDFLVRNNDEYHGVIKKYVCQETAERFASAMLNELDFLSPDTQGKNLAVISTAKLKVTNEREGRENCVCVVVTDGTNQVYGRYDFLTSTSSREYQEIVAAQFIEYCICRFLGKCNYYPYPHNVYTEDDTWLEIVTDLTSSDQSTH